MAALRSSPALAWSVVKACANANLYDKSDMYVCSTAVLGAACGVHVADPLAAYKSKFAGPKKEAPRNQDGTLRFTHADVDLAVLNTNNRLLQACWEVLLPMKSFEHIPNAIRGIGPGDTPMVDFSAYPPGLATLGLGPVPVATLAEGKLKLGNFFGLDFTEEGPPPADGFYSRGVLTGINNGGEVGPFNGLCNVVKRVLYPRLSSQMASDDVAGLTHLALRSGPSRGHGAGPVHPRELRRGVRWVPPHVQVEHLDGEAAPGSIIRVSVWLSCPVWSNCPVDTARYGHAY